MKYFSLVLVCLFFSSCRDHDGDSVDQSDSNSQLEYLNKESNFIGIDLDQSISYKSYLYVKNIIENHDSNCRQSNKEVKSLVIKDIVQSQDNRDEAILAIGVDVENNALVVASNISSSLKVIICGEKNSFFNSISYSIESGLLLDACEGIKFFMDTKISIKRESQQELILNFTVPTNMPACAGGGVEIDDTWGGVYLPFNPEKEKINEIVNKQKQACSESGGVIKEYNQNVAVTGNGVAIGVTSNNSFSILDSHSKIIKFSLCLESINQFIGEPSIISTGTITSSEVSNLHYMNGLIIQMQTQSGDAYHFAFRRPL